MIACMPPRLQKCLALFLRSSLDTKVGGESILYSTVHMNDARIKLFSKRS